MSQRIKVDEFYGSHAVWEPTTNYPAETTCNLLYTLLVSGEPDLVHVRERILNQINPFC